MFADKLFKQLETTRQRTLKLAESVSSQQANLMPSGFNNTIRWHLGHILAIHEKYAFYFINEPLELSEQWLTWFGNGSRPADWTSEPPAVEEILALLQDQIPRFRQRLAGRLEQKLTIPYKDAEIALEMMLSAIHHEAFHAGCISAMIKIIKK